MRIARCPMPNLGLVEIEIMRESSGKGLNSFLYPLLEWREAREVQVWP